MILLVPKSSHSPLAGAAAPATSQGRFQLRRLGNQKLGAKENPELPVFSSPLSFLGEPAPRCYAGSHKNFSVILEWFFCPKRGYSISYPPNLADQTSKKIVSFSFLGTPVSVSEQGVPFSVFYRASAYIKWGGWFFLPFSGRR